ncbi:MAG TPA: hypothetical protein VHG10_13040 [Glycomyces sp.]|nr:hypothetical protein [Glycomyces sp.]
MNDFELHYLHYARSEELFKLAENERLARELVSAAKATRRSGSQARHQRVASRVAKVFGRGERQGRTAEEQGPPWFQPAK